VIESQRDRPAGVGANRHRHAGWLVEEASRPKIGQKRDGLRPRNHAIAMQGWLLEEASPPGSRGRSAPMGYAPQSCDGLRPAIMRWATPRNHAMGYAPQSCDRILPALPDQQMSQLLSGDRMQIIWQKE
jgi:hypothetical protein